MRDEFKPWVTDAIEAGWWVERDLGDSVILRKYKNSHKIGSRPLVTTLRIEDGKVIQSKHKVVGQSQSPIWKFMALGAIVLFILLAIFV